MALVAFVVSTSLSMVVSDPSHCTSSSSCSADDGALKGRVTTIEGEVAALTQRIETLSAEVSKTGAAALQGDVTTHQAAALSETSQQLYAKYASLLHSKYTADSLRAAVGELEEQVQLLKSKILDVENAVSGSGLSARYS